MVREGREVGGGRKGHTFLEEKEVVRTLSTRTTARLDERDVRGVEVEANDEVAGLRTII